MKFGDLRDTLTKEQNNAILIRFADRRNHISHSILYVVQDHSFWFYDARLVGLCAYKSAHELFKSFHEHLRVFFPQSHHEQTDLLLETYTLRDYSESRGQGIL